MTRDLRDAARLALLQARATWGRGRAVRRRAARAARRLVARVGRKLGAEIAREAGGAA